jgi:hypothetical protein
MKESPSVILNVIPMPADPTKIGGTVKMSDPRPSKPAHYSARPMPIEVAAALARKIAREQEALIFIDDTKSLCPKPIEAALLETNRAFERRPLSPTA